MTNQKGEIITIIMIAAVGIMTLGIFAGTRLAQIGGRVNSSAAGCIQVEQLDILQSVAPGDDFDCRVTVNTSQANNDVMACGLSENNGWPQNICPSDTKFKGWQGNTAVFGCIMPENTSTQSTLEMVAFDFSSGCGPTTPEAKRKQIVLEGQPTPTPNPNADATPTARPSPTNTSTVPVEVKIQGSVIPGKHLTVEVCESADINSGYATCTGKYTEKINLSKNIPFYNIPNGLKAITIWRDYPSGPKYGEVPKNIGITKTCPLDNNIYQTPFSTDCLIDVGQTGLPQASYTINLSAIPTPTGTISPTTRPTRTPTPVPSTSAPTNSPTIQPTTTNTPVPPTETPTQAIEVKITNTGFEPTNLTIIKGAKIKWTNTSDEYSAFFLYTCKTPSCDWEEGTQIEYVENITNGQSYSHQFNDTGYFTYFLEDQKREPGIINVRDNSTTNLQGDSNEIYTRAIDLYSKGQINAVQMSVFIQQVKRSPGTQIILDWRPPSEDYIFK